MVQLVELTTDQKKNNDGSADYRGPGDDFPYMGLQVLGALHILLGLALEAVGIAHVALGEEERSAFLNTGSVAIWCPLAAIATGSIGVSMNKKRYWEVRCLREAFWALSLVTGLGFMPALGLVTGLLDFAMYGVWRSFGLTDPVPVKMMTAPSEGMTAVLWLLLALAALEFIVCLVSASVCCCCSPLYKEDPAGAQQQVVTVKQDPVYVEKPPVQQRTVVVEKPVMVQQQQQLVEPQQQILLRPQPQQIMVNQPQPVPPVVYQSLPALPAPARPMVMPQPIYGSAQPYYSMRRF